MDAGYESKNPSPKAQPPTEETMTEQKGDEV